MSEKQPKIPIVREQSPESRLDVFLTAHKGESFYYKIDDGKIILDGEKFEYVKTDKDFIYLKGFDLEIERYNKEDIKSISKLKEKDQRDYSKNIMENLESV